MAKSKDTPANTADENPSTIPAKPEVSDDLDQVQQENARLRDELTAQEKNNLQLCGSLDATSSELSRVSQENDSLRGELVRERERTDVAERKLELAEQELAKPHSAQPTAPLRKGVVVEVRRVYTIDRQPLPVGTEVAYVELCPGLPFNQFLAACKDGFLRPKETES